MKCLVLAAFAAATLIAAPGSAADRPHGGGGGGHAHSGGGHVGGGHAGRAHFSRPMSRGSAAHTHYRSHTAHYRATHYRGAHHPTRHAMHHAAHHATHRAARHAAHHAAATHRDRFSHVRRAVHAARRFHAGTYRHPNGWYAHHWVIGNRLPRAWFARDYWLTDWAIYGLWAPIDGLIWVRVGPDAMLVDPVTGAIVAVDYGLFW
jgi:Ni/Co efflux regulator RcnB